MLTWCAKLGHWLEKENFGLLIFRFFLGSCLIVYSICCFRDVLSLKHLGHAAIALHFPFSDIFWGIFAAFTFIWTGLFILLGFYFRLATITLFVMGLIGAWKHLSWQFFLLPPYSPLSILIILSLAFSFIGPGTFSIKK
jgi:uncharacterized membrane protein YphA (DoxX/SURF4 family)